MRGTYYHVYQDVSGELKFYNLIQFAAPLILQLVISDFSFFIEIQMLILAVFKICPTTSFLRIGATQIRGQTQLTY